MRFQKLFLLFLATGGAIAVSHCAQIDKENTAGNPTPNTNGSSTGGGTFAESLYLADTVTEAPGHTGSGNYNSAGIIDGVRGAGSGAGATTGLFSLDNAAGTSTHVVVRWSGKKVKNGVGADFAVYENAFNIGGNPATRFMDLAFVEVSNDNVNYCGFAPDYTNAPETAYSNNPANWLRFAGRTPVIYNIDVPVTNFTAAQLFQDNDANYEGDLGGGDLFDLDLLSDNNDYSTGCTTALRDELKTNGFTYLKLIPAKRRNNPVTGVSFLSEAVSNGPDFDGIVARYAE
jgi:hypothetical protein